MAFDTYQTRVKALEKLTAAQGRVVAIFLPSDTSEERAAKESLIAEARERGVEAIVVRIGAGRAGGE